MSMPIMIFMTSYYPNPQQYSRISAVKIFKFQHLLSGFFLLMLLFSACSEKATIIGTDMLPDKDFVNIMSTDTISVQSYSELIDSTLTNNLTYSYLGGLKDPYYGSMSADFVAQLRLYAPWPGGGEFGIDSVKLFFSIAGAKGSLETNLLCRIFEIDEDLYMDSLYYSNRSPHAGLELCSFQMPSITKDTVQIMAVNLPVSVGEYLTRDTTKLFQGTDVEDFQTFFKGIYFTTEEQTKSGAKGVNGLLVALSFNTDEFLLKVYYHNSSAGSHSYEFIINTNSVRYNRYSFDYSTAEPGKMIQHINDGYRDTLAYLQSFGGVFTTIKLPGLEYYKDLMPLSVNKARLQFPVFLDDDVYKNSTMPSMVYLRYRDSDGVIDLVPDYYLSSDFYDGTFNATQVMYTFNIAVFVQKYLEGEIPDPVLEMYVPDTEYRNVIFKANDASVSPKFNFVYIPF
jgi:hypothetical protein